MTLADLRRNPQARKLRAVRERTVRDRRRRRCSSPALASATACRRSPGCSIRMRFAELDAVTVDGYGTLVRLVDPVPALARALARARRRVETPRQSRAGVRGRGRLLPAERAAAGATRRAWPRSGSSARAIFLEARRRRPRAGVVRRRLHGLDRVRADRGRVRDAPRPPRARARARGRLELGHRPGRAPRATRASRRSSRRS